MHVRYWNWKRDNDDYKIARSAGNLTALQTTRQSCILPLNVITSTETGSISIERESIADQNLMVVRSALSMTLSSSAETFLEQSCIQHRRTESAYVHRSSLEYIRCRPFQRFQRISENDLHRQDIWTADWHYAKMSRQTVVSQITSWTIGSPDVSGTTSEVLTLNFSRNIRFKILSLFIWKNNLC